MSISRKDFFTMGSAAMAATVLPNVSGTGNKIPSLIKPKALQEGATLGLVAPASPIHDEADFEQMLLDLERLGYKYKLGHHVKDKYGYLAGKDEDRASDLMSMFEDEEVDGIITVRGGWGCNRILPYLDFEKIKNNPKLFAGFSDITSLHQAILSKTGLVTFHGPVGKSDWNEFTELSWRSVVQNKQMPVFQIPE
ncbi:MAG TPA: LD-carboxypeptidase, partial [Balneolaceae bacterium]|nr:LD-carboxypeptidase [Balneolaceae bacterium]